MPNCRKCGREVWVKIPWGNTWFCREHFIEYFERKVWRTFTKYVPKTHKRVLLAVSGGKDSLALLYSLAPKLIRENYSVSVLHVDLGITGYSEYARRVVEIAASEVGVELIVYSLAERDGFTIDSVASVAKAGDINKPVCSLCGVVKRYVYNSVAVKQCFDLVVTGHNLDDVFAFAVSDLATGNVRDLIKLKPYLPSDSYFVARAKPLFFNYELENALYTIARSIEAVKHPCPYRPVKEKSLVTTAKSLLRDLEKHHPSIGLLFVKNLVNRILPVIQSRAITAIEGISSCSVCGMPSQTNPCSFCRLKARVVSVRAGRESYGLGKLKQ